MLRPKRKRRAPPEVKTHYFPFDGGANLVDAPLSVKEGMVLGAVNYEQRVRGGYRRIEGHERFDGRSSPSDADYWILDFDAGVTKVNQGDTVTGLSSGATGIALVDGVLETGAYDGSGTGYLVLGRTSGTPFTDGEDLQVSAATVCDADGIESINNASNDTDHATYQQAAIEDLRVLIEKVGASDGSGPVRGVHVFHNGDVYAWRNNAAATECLMYKATTAGWILQALGNRVSFTLGTAEYLETETLTQGGVTSTINRVVKQSGTWGSDAAGYLIIGTVTAGPYVSGIATSASGSATLSGAETANTIQPGGKYEIINHNFYGDSATKRMYGVNGVDYMFEFDGTVYVPLITGNTVDTPSHIAQYKFHLFYSLGSSLQNSATGNPYVYAGSGANEIGVGGDIVGIREEVGNTLAILQRNKTKMLYGSDTTDFDLKTISEEAGGIEWTMQRIGAMRYMDDRGFTSLDSVQAFGDFKDNVYSQVIEPLIEQSKENVTYSSINRTKNQHRVYFNDGTAIYSTFDNKKIKGFMTVSLTDGAGDVLSVYCASNGEDSNGSEVNYFGGDDGFVYQMDKGTSFDGAPIEAFIVLSYVHLKSPEYIKEFLKVVMEVSATTSINLLMTPSFDYDEREDSQQVLPVLAAGDRWNIANWNEFLWSSPGVGNPEAYIDGSGRNISMLLFSEDTYAQPHTLLGATLHYMFRRRNQ